MKVKSTIPALPKCLADLERAKRNLNGQARQGVIRGLVRAGQLGEQLAPKRTGRMASDWGVSEVTGGGELVWRQHYAPVIDLAGSGRWSGLVSTLGPPPRFGYRAVDELKDEIPKEVEQETAEEVSAYGWFSER